MKAFSKVEFYDRVLWKNYLAVIGVVGTIVTLISFFVTAEEIDRFSEKQLAAFLVAGLVLIFSVMWYSANHRKASMYISTVHIFFIPMIRRSGSILHSLQNLIVLPTAQ